MTPIPMTYVIGADTGTGSYKPFRTDTYELLRSSGGLAVGLLFYKSKIFNMETKYLTVSPSI
jgi:hypothetical protein